MRASSLIIITVQYSDIARFLNMYQLWLDDLYPRAKFADGLTIIEKLGHTKRIQIMRKEWIEEGKPRTAETDPEDDDIFGLDDSNHPVGEDVAKTNVPERIIQDQTEEVDGFSNGAEQLLHIQEGAEPDEDELDALLAEDGKTMQSIASKPPRATEDDFADELEAMAGMEDMW